MIAVVTGEVGWLVLVNVIVTWITIVLLGRQLDHAVEHLSGDVMGELHRQATRDGLTGALTATTFAQLGERMHIESLRYAPGAAVLVLDLDKFKGVNDRLGHQRGDTVLRAVAATIATRLRESDQLGRIGGDEFAVLMPNTTSDGACKVGHDVAAAIESASLEGVTASIGAACLADFPTWDAALHAADQGMYVAKRSGGAGVQVSGGGRDQRQERVGGVGVREVEQPQDEEDRGGDQDGQPHTDAPHLASAAGVDDDGTE